MNNLRRVIRLFCLMTILLALGECAIAKDVVLNSSNIFSGTIQANKTYVIEGILDLHKKNLRLPEGVTLKIKKNGIIRNGRITGNKTSVTGEGPFFDAVEIAGTWNIPTIKTSMFSDLTKDNSLRDVFALTDPGINNKVIVDDGNYYVSVEKNAETCLKISSNTEIVLKGSVILRKNQFPNYSIISLKGNNIQLKGKGNIIGDRETHIATAGEWGMCLTISGNNIHVHSVNIKNAWGDCVYITGSSNCVEISGCTIDSGRRQGISIISAKNVKVRDCVIKNIRGTSPEYAIDVEPNQNDSVSNVIIEKTTIFNCQGGFSANGRAANSSVNNIVLKQCDISANGRPVVIATTANDISVKSCLVTQTYGDKVISFDHVNNLTVANNKVTYSSGVVTKTIEGLIKMVGYNYWPMIISDCNNTSVVNNNGL